MIKNSLKYTKIYENLSKNMKIGLDYIKNNDLTNIKLMAKKFILIFKITTQNL